MIRGDEQPKTYVGILASHDCPKRNEALARLFDYLYRRNDARLAKFHYLFTGGTYDRVVLGKATDSDEECTPVALETRSFLSSRSTTLPSRSDGGVTLLSHCVVQRHCSILWPFLTPLTSHWLNPENLALMRLSDQWHVKRLMTSGSVREWFETEADVDKVRNVQPCPIQVSLPGTGLPIHAHRREDGGYKISRPVAPPMPERFGELTVALIAHDEMKKRMVEFAVDYAPELLKFERLLCTGTTGKEVGDAVPALVEERKIYRYHSGPKGGDIQIACEILFGRCQVVIFFIDPLRPHPHIEDIRVVFGACMIQDGVRMLTNEMQARDWMDRVVKGTARALSN